MTAQDKARIRWGLAACPLLDDEAWATRNSKPREVLRRDVYDARMELAMAEAMTTYLVENPPPEDALTPRDFAKWAAALEADGRMRLALAKAG
jgi:hypothetical protein